MHGSGLSRKLILKFEYTNESNYIHKIRATGSSIENNKKNMNSNNYAPKVAGIMFIVLIITHMLSTVFFDPTTIPQNISDTLISLSKNPTNGYISFFLLLTSNLGAVVLAVMLYVVLKLYDKNLALLAMSFRLAEAMIGIFSKTSMLALFALSKDYVNSEASDPTFFHILAEFLYSASNYAVVIAAISFSVGSFIFNFLFYKSRFVPRFISVFGMIASILVLFGMILQITTVGYGSVILYIWITMMISELMYGFWLPIKGIKN